MGFQQIIAVVSSFLQRSFFPVTVQDLFEEICDKASFDDIVAWTEPLTRLKNQDNFRYTQLRRLIVDLTSLLEESPATSSTDLKEAAKQVTSGLTISFQKPHLEKLMESLNNSEEEVEVLSGPSSSTPNPGTQTSKRKSDTDTSTTHATGKGKKPFKPKPVAYVKPNKPPLCVETYPMIRYTINNGGFISVPRNRNIQVRNVIDRRLLQD